MVIRFSKTKMRHSPRRNAQARCRVDLRRIWPPGSGVATCCLSTATAAAWQRAVFQGDLCGCCIIRAAEVVPSFYQTSFGTNIRIFWQRRWRRSTPKIQGSKKTTTSANGGMRCGQNGCRARVFAEMPSTCRCCRVLCGELEVGADFAAKLHQPAKISRLSNFTACRTASQHTSWYLPASGQRQANILASPTWR